MDKILNGIVKSNKDKTIKEAVIKKVRDAGSSGQSVQSVTEVIQLTMSLMLNERDPFIVDAAKSVYNAWVLHNRQYLLNFFTTKTVHSLLAETFDVPENVAWILNETFAILVSEYPSRYPEYCNVVEMRVIDFLRRNQSPAVMYGLSNFLLKHYGCIPKERLTITFCETILTNLGNYYDFAKKGTEPFLIIKYINGDISSLLGHIWSNSHEQVINASLKCIFGMLSKESREDGRSASVCLAGVVKHIPKPFMEPSIQHLVNDVTVRDTSLSLALKCMVTWLSWPGATAAVDWVKTFITGLLATGKHVIVKNCVENDIDNVADLIVFPVVREGGFEMMKFVLLTSPESPDPWLKIAGTLSEKIQQIRKETKPNQKAQVTDFLTRLTEFIYCMVQLHPGFPDIYETLLNTVQDFPRPVSERIDAILKSYATSGSTSVARNSHRSSAQAQIWLKKSATGKIGLANLGNTCYMNSVLQAIFMCDSFRQDVLSSIPSGNQLLLVKLQYVFSFLTASHRPFYYPDAFYEASRPSWFEKGYQQDCSEFLRHLLDQLDDQEMANYRSSLSKSNSTQSTKKEKSGFNLFKHKTKESKSAPERLNNCVEYVSLISKTFGGNLLNTYQCLKCKSESNTTEKFTDIALAFPDNQSKRSSKNKEKHKLKGGSSDDSRNPSPVPHQSSSSILTLNDMIKNFLTPEILAGENKYKCEKCKGLQEAERRISITKAPEYLILTLLRFSFDLKKNRRSKIFTDVKYPKTLQIPIAETCNVTESTSAESKKSRRKSPTNSSDMSETSARNDVTYALCGVVVHSGLTSEAGHYYSYARHSIPVDDPTSPRPGELPDYLQDKWFLFNDSRVTFSSYESFSEVTQKFAKDTAYQLLYRKIDRGLQTVGGSSTIMPQLVDPPLRIDLLNAVDKDNERFIHEQEMEARRKEAEQRRSGFSLWGWKDSHDRGPPPPSCGGGGGGGMGFNAHFVC